MKHLSVPINAFFLAFVFFFIAKSNASQQLILTPELRNLVQVLESSGYKVKFDNPPLKGSLGITNTRKREVWVAPITQPMGIFKQTLLHEAVHAAQACPKGSLSVVGWDTNSFDIHQAVKDEIKSILYLKYERNKFALEKEAFLMQGHNNATEMIINALKERCFQE